MVDRAKVILGCLAGRRNDEVAAELGIQAATVGTWRKRFASEGLAGLRDRARPGKPPVYPASELRQRILKQLEAQPPAGLAGWDGGTLAQALGVSDDVVWRVLCKEGIQLRRHRSWCVSTDPEFSAKAAGVIGLYLSPPQNALVLSVDEKPSIQALERNTGYVCTSSGKVVRGLKSTYKRHGTINLFAALNVATGSIQSKTTATKKRPDFQAFMDRSLISPLTGKFTSFSTTTARTRKTMTGWPSTRMFTFISRPLRQVGSTKWKSGLASSPARLSAVQALPAPINWSVQSRHSSPPTTNRPLPSSGASVKSRDRNSEIQLLIYAIKQ